MQKGTDEQVQQTAWENYGLSAVAPQQANVDTNRNRADSRKWQKRLEKGTDISYHHLLQKDTGFPKLADLAYLVKQYGIELQPNFA